MNVFRAVENRVYVVRCANTGISCFINPQGRVVSRVTDAAGSEIGARGFLTDVVRLSNEKTFYTRHGDLFAKACSAIAAIILVAVIPAAWGLARYNRRQESSSS